MPPPIEEDRQTAHIIRTLIFVFWAAFAVLIGFGFYWSDTKLILAAAAAMALQAVPFLLLKRGRFMAGGLVLMLIVLAAVTLVATLGQGSRDLGVLAFPVIFIFAGLALKRSFLAAGVILAIAAAGWLVFGENRGWFVPSPFSGKPGWPEFTLLSVILSAAAFAVDLLASNTRRSLRQARLEIVQRQEAEEKVRASLKEKETLLREIHHRVKNNMQLISSLLRLQSGFVKDKADAALFKESQNRIRTMARVYNKLYESPDLARIGLREYVSDLIADLVASYRLEGIPIRTDINIDAVTLPLETAIPCGLVLNEIAVNSLKHAFPEARGGLLTIAIHRAGEGSLEMRVADDGIGMPQGFDESAAPSLGSALIRTIVEDQLAGTLVRESGRGTAYTIRFKTDLPSRPEDKPSPAV